MTRWSKLTTRQKVESSQRPHIRYKAEFMERILASDPRSLLDVGCGDGALLEAAAARGCARCTGMEPHDEAPSRQGGSTFEIVPGRAEALPFADASFDVVTLQYVAHHVEDLPRAVGEAIRVARHAVHILDPWYDPAIPSQRVALDFDLWLKTIDRRLGQVHNPCPLPFELTRLVSAFGRFEIDFACRLVLCPLDSTEVERQAQAHLALIGDDPDLAHAATNIIDRARLHGISDDGALLFSARRLH